MYKDVAAGIYVGEWDDKDSAEIHVDEQRTKIFQRMWNFHLVVTQQAYPTTLKADTLARKNAGSKIKAIANKYFASTSLLNDDK